ncbi:MAG TPA: flagellar basal body L-ring protein FlgH [Syntrophorhabdaceae bacterium]|nr:flagellar basal body L-ring protein FlgH [Syntrophorhabdaceae bacterium]
MRPRYLCLIIICAFLMGCNTTNYTSRIKGEEFVIDNAFKHEERQKEVKVTKTGTIWPGERSFNSFFTDGRAARIGDILTVKIVEATKSNEKATTDVKRTGANVNLGIPNFLGMEYNQGGRGFISPDKLVTATVKNDFKGEGETVRDGSIVATISAKVVEVMPNGNLAIEGKRDITLNNERKEMLFQGVVRPKDIAADNSVFSTQVADAKIILAGVGVISEKQSPGWFARILDLLWPF